MRSSTVTIVALLASFWLGAVPAHATHYIVDPNGGGDFASIQAGLNAQWVEWRDSLLIWPDDYAETVTLTNSPYYLGPLDGTGRIQIDSLVTDDTYFGLTLDHFTFRARVELGPQLSSSSEFRACVFQWGVTVSGLYPPRFVDCDFFGPVDLRNVENPGHAPLQSSRFHSAPLSLGASNGTVTMIDCVFEGPADTLVRLVRATSDDLVEFVRCRFESANYGIVHELGYGEGLSVSDCQFRALDKAGVWYEQAGQLIWPVACSIQDSRFEDCGKAVHWRGLLTNTEGRWMGVGVRLLRDTVISCSDVGLELGPLSRSTIDGCVVDRSGGHGVVVRQDHPTTGWCEEGLSLVLNGSSFTNNHGTGLVIRDSTSSNYDSVTDAIPGPDHVIRGSSFVGNFGRGADLSCGDLIVEGCLIFANQDDGLAWRTSAPTKPVQLVSNSSALNGGDGFLFTGTPHTGDSPWLLQRNLGVLNAGAGFRVPHQSFGSFAFNDAWNNYQGQYVGAWDSADSNLTVDPRYCDLGAGNLGLQQGSPAGAGGVYGLIGALPEQCSNTTSVEPVAPRLSFAVRPSVARGSVEFAPPSSGPDGRVEIFDVTGRRHWGAAFGPTTGLLRWTGQSENGHAQPGLYWVRFTRAGETQSQRLVWLR